MEAKLWDSYWKNRTDGNRNRLVEYFYYLAEKCAARQVFLAHECVTYEELLCPAGVGLLQAVEKYAKTTASFATYSNIRMKGAIKDYFRDIDHMPRKTRQFMKKRNEIKLLFQANGEAISDEIVAAKLNLSAQIYKTHDEISQLTGQSLDNFTINEDADFFIDGLIDPRSVSQFYDIDYQDLVSYYIDLIGDKIKYAEQMLTLRYREDLTLAQIGERLGFTESYACLLLKDISKEIRRLEVAKGRNRLAA